MTSSMRLTMTAAAAVVLISLAAPPARARGLRTAITATRAPAGRAGKPDTRARSRRIGKAAADHRGAAAVFSSGYTAQTWVWGGRPVDRCTPATCTGAEVPAANVMAVWGVEIVRPTEVSHVLFDVVTGDPTGSYSFAIYGPYSSCASTCPLVASTTAATYGTSQTREDAAFSQGSVTLEPGIYFIGWTGNATALQLALSGGYASDRYDAFLAFDDSTATSGGSAPSTITTPTLQLTAGVSVTTILPFFYLTQLACGPSC